MVKLVGVRLLCAALDARDRCTGTHSPAPVSRAVTVARGLNLGCEEIAATEHVALMHDIGKICIPDHILQKQGPLDPCEWQTMHRHPAIGAQIVSSISSLAHLAPTIRAEHECWDGTGYPDGLGGEQIPVVSRIVGACDALQAMTSDRPHRRAMAPPDALRGLRYQAGSQFDPLVVDALLDSVATDTAISTRMPHNTQPSVLLVDDDATLRFALERGLTSEGFRVRVAASASEAYLAIAEMSFDVIVMDWLLRGGDSGDTACRRLRYLHPHGEIVVLSALSDIRDQHAALKCGARAILHKDIAPKALAEHLHTIAQAT
jgi:response regulator RpfG family c-di-GMP phosphodiesterase